jgi:putative NADH-flavin reductase
MKMVVLGATGGTGLEIVRQAIEHGHTVTAFVRAPDRLKTFGDRVAVIQGDLLSSGELRRVLGDHDAVLSGFGPRLPASKADANLLRHFAVALTSAMLNVGIRRVVVVSTAFLFKDSIISPTYLVGRLFFPDIVADAWIWSR